MNCFRCLANLLPGLHNTEQLSLQCLGISVTLNKLNCANCRLCIYLKVTDDKWMQVHSIPATAGKGRPRTGWEAVEAPDELVKFYALSQVLYNQIEGEMDAGDAFFDFPDENDVVKILWVDGIAVGFYTVKRKESIVFDTMESYAMTTLDTAYIRKSHRGKGYGISILEDLVKTFPDEDIGISTPISTAMYRVVLRFLSMHPSYRTKLWEISGVGSEGNRKLVYFSLKKLFAI